MKITVSVGSLNLKKNWNKELVSRLKGREKADESENWNQQQIRCDQYHKYYLH